MYHIPAEELSELCLFTFFGLAALGLLAWAFFASGVASRLLSRLRALARRPRLLVAGASLLALLGSASVARLVLEDTVLTDDENTYRFMAQTLRSGSVVAPSPGRDLAYFRELFVVLNENVRYGKYPIGHAVLLAVGQALGAERFVGAVLTALLAAAVYRLSWRVYESRPAAAAAAFFACTSPTLLLTGATFLSQPTAALFLTLGILALFEAEAGRAVPWLLAAGAAFGFAVLARPLPSALFAMVAIGAIAMRLHKRTSQARTRETPRPDPGVWPAFLTPLIAFAALFLLVNQLQSGNAFSAGYQAYHIPEAGAAKGTLLLFGGRLADMAFSVAGSLLRLHGWFLGWPFALALCLFAKGEKTRLLWAMLAADGLYRLASPKTGVGLTGSLYVLEAVPILCVLAAGGVKTLCQWADRKKPAFGAAIVAVVLSGTALNLAMFLPVRLSNLRKAVEARLALPRLLDAQDVRNAVVFHRGLVPQFRQRTWAFFPPHNPPGYDASILYLWLADDDPTLAGAREVLRRHFPNRTGWLYIDTPERRELVSLAALSRRATGERSGP